MASIDSRTAIPDRTIWVAKAHTLLRPVLLRRGLVVPHPVVVTVGRLPKGVGGQCTLSTSAPPVITVSDEVQRSMAVLGILVHEAIHASLPMDQHHGPTFRLWAKRIGLMGPPTASTLGPRLRLRLAALTDRLGPYPRATDAVVVTSRGDAVT